MDGAGVCEHLFPSVTSEGHAYARFRRALDSRNAGAAFAAASELTHVGLADALELCLLVRDGEPARYERAAIRWHANYCRDTRAGLAEAQAVLGLLAAIAGPHGKRAARSLAELFEHRAELRRAAEVLVQWSTDRAS